MAIRKLRPIGGKRAIRPCFGLAIESTKMIKNIALVSNASLAAVLAQIDSAKDKIKAGAVAAREAAPKGEKMAHGQHFAATHAATVAATGLQVIAERGFVPSAIAPKVSKSGKVEFVVTYRETQTLAQRIATVTTSRERRKAARAAAAAEKAAKVVTLSNANANAAASDVLKKLAA
jgi:hypothetical protein